MEDLPNNGRLNLFVKGFYFFYLNYSVRFFDNPIRRRTLFFKNPIRRCTLFFNNPIRRRTLFFNNPSRRCTSFFNNPIRRRTLFFNKPIRRRTLFFNNPSRRRTLFLFSKLFCGGEKKLLKVSLIFRNQLIVFLRMVGCKFKYAG